MKTKPSITALVPPTPDQVKHVVSELDQRWSRTALKALDRFEQAVDAGDGLQSKYWGVSAGISTEKTLLIRGVPTQVVTNIHEVRVSMPEIMEKLAIAARVLSTHQRKGYASLPQAKVIAHD